MDWQQIIGLVIAGLIMLIGVLGCVLPGIPGAPLVFIAALAHRLWFGEAASASIWVLAIIFLIMLFSVAVDYLASMYGAKKLGASRNGIIGAVLGGIIGFLTFNPIVLLVGPFAGAFIGEKIGGKDWKTSGKAGLGATLGLLGGAVGKLACAIAMTGLFSVSVIWKMWAAAN
jgi:uncharacterized protein YqgC (DUF456 family)